MVQQYSAVITKEDSWYVAQCVEVDIASQGETEEEALRNLQEAIELHFEKPRATITPTVRTFTATVHAA
ncbi:MAG: type II toxin-antitoxin system HicB family antitoxin [Bacteroidetes bacterium]|nr:MAG: type II toxin-antitoxin system HicB family antitoxin [Bacteroidota bacterium]